MISLIRQIYNITLSIPIRRHFILNFHFRKYDEMQSHSSIY